MSSYRAKNYQQAIEHFSQYNNADADYNRANALAFSKKYKEAIEAYDQALKKNSTMADAKYNREIIKKLLEKQKQKEQKQNKRSSQNKKDQKKNKDQQQKKQAKNNQQQDDKEKEKKKNEKQAQKKEQQKKQTKNQQEKSQQKENKQQPKMTRKQRENDQSDKQLLNRIPDDPGGLLRRKFHRDYQRRLMEAAR